ncbi:MAG: hypothetical protein QXU32_01850 [Nitrososphaerales archaeon]
MMNLLSNQETIGGNHARGEIEFIFRDKYGHEIGRQVEHNIVKIFAKEILAYRMPYSKVWDPNAGSGAGAWVSSGIDVYEEFAPKYILFGASFDENNIPLDANDPRYYTKDSVTGVFVPNVLGVGAEFDGELINAIPLSEPNRPLKRIEKISFLPSYQPSGTPLLQHDVRAINNIVLLETTLRLNEYNGFGLTDSDFFTITEVALAGGRIIDASETCNKKPRECFLQGNTSTGQALLANANGTDVVTLDISESDVDLIKEGDQIKIVAAGGTASAPDTLDQISPHYLVVGKAVGGHDIQLDRIPVDASNNPIIGPIGLFRDTLRIFSHRILSTPVKKSNNFEIIVRWKIIFS